MRTWIVIWTLLGVAMGAALYDFKTSYVLQLTPLNFGDQVAKYRQNTHYVSVVHFYSAAGTSTLMQMANQLTSFPTWTAG